MRRTALNITLLSIVFGILNMAFKLLCSWAVWSVCEWLGLPMWGTVSLTALTVVSTKLEIKFK